MLKKILLGLFIILPTYSLASVNVCTMDALQCPDGSWIGRSGPNCEFICNDMVVNSNENECDQNESPVCAQPPMPVCPKGMMCAQVMPNPKTYMNECYAKKDNAEIINNGACESDMEQGKDEQDYALEGCLSWYDGCNICSVNNGNLEACTEMACNVNATPYCKQYKLDEQMKKLLAELNGEVMFLGGSKYFDEASGDYKMDLIKADLMICRKMLLVNEIDEEVKIKINKQILKLEGMLDSSTPVITMDEKMKCELDGGKYILINNKTLVGMGLCTFNNGKSCEASRYLNGTCPKLFNSAENKRVSQVYNAFRSVIDKKHNLIDNKIKLMFQINKKIQILKSNLDNLNHILLVYNAIDNGFNKYLLELFTQWGNDNLEDIVLQEPVLGGSWYLLDVEKQSNYEYKFVFEDGHIQSVVNVEFAIENGELVYELVN